MERTIFLIDMNAFFASVEQIMNPSLRGKPIAVCGNGRTVVTTASYEARKYGVKTGMSVPEAKRMCPGLIPVIGDLDKYVDTSLRLHKIFLKFTDQVEAFSIDECFMDVSHLCKSDEDPAKIAQDIKNRIKEKFGLLCSIGIGDNKVVAKLSSKMQKPDGLVEIRKKNIPELFAKIPVEKLQGVGVGRKTSQKLLSLGINTAKNLGDTSIDKLTFYFGFVGHYLKRVGMGEDDAPVGKYLEYEQVKSVGHSHTLPNDTWNTEVVKSYIMMLSEKTGSRLRKYGLIGKTVTLVIRYADFSTFHMQTALKSHVSETENVYHTAFKIFKKILPLKKAVRLVGVSIGNLKKNDGQQFLLENMKKRGKLTELLDNINKKYGSFTIKPSSVIISEKFGIQKPCGMIGKFKIK
ncbi:DNA polymerase IV [Elusimicrobiota bacterium]